MPIFRLSLAILLTAAALCAQNPESFAYQVEWRLINAGRTELTWDRTANGYKSQLKLYSQGLVSRLFKVNDIYDVHGTGDLCAQQARLQAEEGSRKRDTTVRWSDKKSFYLERDLLKNETILERQLDTPGCVHDVVAGLAKLRMLKDLRPGQSTTLPISDGKKQVMARIEAQEREKVTTKVGSFQAIRYEAFLFNDVLFKRNARLFIWISDDARRLPLQIQVRMRIHIGTVTFTLDKVDPPTEAMKK
ncbi:MAG TPA: DUF3108 domain-containing protein [Bryobacteraceae bacterium]|nr:DUF3108 domain-containing protein [Bryobacteraceae bacterium]